jgi:putative ABC transport system permease protein
MNPLVNFRIALRSLRVNKLRSLLTMLGIIFGTGSVIAMISVGTGAQIRIQEEIKTIGANMIVVIPGQVNTGGVRRGQATRLTLTEADAAAIRAEVPAVVVTSPTTSGKGQVIYGNANWSTSIFGITPDYHISREWEVVDGRTFDQDDIIGARKVALVGQTVVEKIFGQRDPIGQTIRIDRVPFTVVGIMDRKGQNMAGQDNDDVVLLPLSTARNRLLGRNQVNARSVTSILVKIQEGGDMNEAMTQIQDAVRTRHRLQPWQDDDFQLRNIADVLKAKEEASRVMSLFLTAIASVSLIVGGVGIMNIMLVSVTERTREIGLRIAMGARYQDIMTQFLTEAVTLSMVGGFIGVMIGVGGSWAIADYAGFRVELQPQAIMVALVFAVAVGVIFGYLPARKAARLDPVEALRCE